MGNMSNKDKKKPEPIKWDNPGPKLGEVVSNDENGVNVKLTEEGEKLFKQLLRNAVVQGKPTIGRV